MQNWSKLVFVLILCNSLIVTGEKKNPTLSFLRYRVVPARQVPFPGSPEGSPGNGTWLAGTTLSRRMTAWDSLSPLIGVSLVDRFYCTVQPVMRGHPSCSHFPQLIMSFNVDGFHRLNRHISLGKWNEYCFRPPLCALFRLNWAKQTQGTMRWN